MTRAADDFSRGLRVAVGLLAAIFLAACGGDDSDDSGSDSIPDDFAEKADAICAESVREQLEVSFSVPGDPSTDDIAEQMRELETVASGTLAELQALEPREEDAEQWEAYLENRRRAVELVGERDEAAERDDGKELDRLAAEIQELVRERDEIGAGLGLGACGRVLSDEQAREVRDVVEAVVLTEDPEELCELTAEVFIERNYGGSFERCVRSQRDRVTADSAEFGEITGVDEVAARAGVTLEGPPGAGGELAVELVYEDDGYKVFATGTPGDG